MRCPPVKGPARCREELLELSRGGDHRVVGGAGQLQATAPQQLEHLLFASFDFSAVEGLTVATRWRIDQAEQSLGLVLWVLRTVIPVLSADINGWVVRQPLMPENGLKFRRVAAAKENIVSDQREALGRRVQAPGHRR